MRNQTFIIWDLVDKASRHKIGFERKINYSRQAL